MALFVSQTQKIITEKILIELCAYNVQKCAKVKAELNK